MEQNARHPRIRSSTQNGCGNQPGSEKGLCSFTLFSWYPCRRRVGLHPVPDPACAGQRGAVPGPSHRPVVRHSMGSGLPANRSCLLGLGQSWARHFIDQRLLRNAGNTRRPPADPPPVALLPSPSCCHLQQALRQRLPCLQWPWSLPGVCKHGAGSCYTGVPPVHCRQLPVVQGQPCQLRHVLRRFPAGRRG